MLRLDEVLSNYLQLHKGQGKGDNIQWGNRNKQNRRKTENPDGEMYVAIDRSQTGPLKTCQKQKRGIRVGDVTGLLSLLQLSECGRVQREGAVKTPESWLILWAGKACDQVRRAEFKPPRY